MFCRSKPVPLITAGRPELLLAEGQEDTIQLTVAFRNSANAHKNYIIRERDFAFIYLRIITGSLANFFFYCPGIRRVGLS